MCKKWHLIDEENLKINQIRNNYILWNNFSHDEVGKIFSIPRIIENNSEKFRSDYLKLIYKLGETTLYGKKLTNILMIRDNLSFWWMSLLNEKCNFSKSQSINNIIKILALDYLSEKENIKKIEIEISNKELMQYLIWWSSYKKISISFCNTKVQSNIGFLKKIYNAAPIRLKAIAWFLVHIASRWPLKGIGIKDWKKSRAQVSFVSYLANIKAPDQSNLSFQSNYWGPLPDYLKEEKINSNWMHIFVKNKDIKNPKAAANLINELNKKSSLFQTHVTPYTFMNIKLCFKSFFEWISIQRKIPDFNEIISNSNIPKHILLMFETDWKRSFYGPQSISNIFQLHLFETAFKENQTQKIGFYLLENQPWEYALISSWKSSKHNILTGIAHTIVRFWDLRYHFHAKLNDDSSKSKIPQPDYIGINGKISENEYLKSSYPKDRLKSLEALRFLHLCNSKAKKVYKRPKESKKLKLLILTDYLESNTKRQLLYLSSIIDKVSSKFDLYLKFHPISPVNLNDYPSMPMKILDGELADILTQYEYVYASSFTTSALEAYLLGIKVVSIIDPCTLNLNPLRDIPNSISVTDENSLLSALEKIENSSFKFPKYYKPLFLNSNLNYWKIFIDKHI